MDSQNAGGKPPVKTQGDLRAHFGQLNQLAEKKVLNHLDKFCRDFIALSPFLVLASSDGKGHADASPRGDAPGFVAVLDDKTLLIPDRRGNNRVDTFGNILASPGIGLIFLVPGVNETLRVNGRAEISQDAELLTPLAMQNVVPIIGLKIHVEETFFHCGKALMRSKLWNPAAQVERNSFPTLGRIVAEQTAAIAVEEAEKVMEEGYRTRLY
ncbi:pyridoxamine 5'-phosphate oxidase family protein [Bradyrhizobium liaoningense]|uniref:pyridoxamine 5'-phosphate oxidase family protein n=1 Tax=Bradyrhizobium liaoningense TaxID=43992 RepID=UPI001BA8627B|nr:pyridoxamine 5'-phosphate oxidase family protein [Bradyrhizobium liaoningense]MBR0739467.1 pyridoxamine 5'-phosphate oxidase family protein [Bradyrhizobium liaoningense]